MPVTVSLRIGGRPPGVCGCIGWLGGAGSLRDGVLRGMELGADAVRVGDTHPHTVQPVGQLARLVCVCSIPSQLGWTRTDSSLGFRQMTNLGVAVQ